jgi:hypothetical protein
MVWVQLWKLNIQTGFAILGVPSHVSRGNIREQDVAPLIV